MNAFIGLLWGAGLAVSLLVAVLAWRGEVRARLTARRGSTLSHATWKRIGYAVAAGLVVAVLTRWPVAVVAVVALVVLWPKMVGAAATSQAELDRLEALTTWTESLRDTIAGSIGLEQAIPATVAAAPETIRPALDRLVGSMSSRLPLQTSLARFADEFGDPTADLVVAALILNARLRGPGLAATLGALAITAREQLEMRRRVAEGRRVLRRSVMIIVAVVVAFSGGLVLFSRSYVAPYTTIPGQAVLVIVLACFAGAFIRMRQLAVTEAPERFLAAPAQIASLTDETPAGGGRR